MKTGDYPQTLIADNMLYNSTEMKEYAKQYGINIITTSPTYSQANGLDEKAVHIVKFTEKGVQFE